jgi:hypothetical protein
MFVRPYLDFSPIQLIRTLRAAPAKQFSRAGIGHARVSGSFFEEKLPENV